MSSAGVTAPVRCTAKRYTSGRRRRYRPPNASRSPAATAATSSSSVTVIAAGFDARWVYSVWAGGKFPPAALPPPPVRQTQRIKRLLVVAPIRLDLDAQVEKDLALEEAFDVFARLGADPLDHRPPAADDDGLLRFGFAGGREEERPTVRR